MVQILKRWKIIILHGGLNNQCANEFCGHPDTLQAPLFYHPYTFGNRFCNTFCYVWKDLQNMAQEYCESL